MGLFRLYNFLILLVFFSSVIVFNIIAPELGFKSFAFAMFALATLIISIIPIKLGLIFTFIYIGLEGFLKVVSGYHPVIHVGSDVLIIFLSLKAVFESLIVRGENINASPPYLHLFLLHFVWIFICLFNPYGLGFLPSIAGSKVYITMLFLFFFGYSQTKTMKDADDFIKPFLIVVILHTVFGIYQGMVGEGSVLGLHPGYAAQLEKFRNRAFRPFGLTNLPGGPAVYLSFSFPLILYVIFTARSWIVRTFFVSFLPAGLFLFLLCQVRASLLKMIIGSLIFLIGMVRFVAGDRQKMGVLLIFLCVVTIGSVYFLPQLINVYVQKNELNEQAVDRSMSVFDVDTVKKARPSIWPRFFAYAQAAPMGAGFSRIGGASAKFADEIKKNPYFPANYFFADNFWVACLIEIGIPGMMILTAILLCIFIGGYQATQLIHEYDKKLMSLALFGSLTAMMIGLYASEGVLYNPDACFFWFFSGVLLKLPKLT